jgi:hypothetical protein
MKSSIAIALLAFSSFTAFAGEVKIKMPVTGYYYKNNKEVKIDIPKLNKELNKLGLAGIPEVVTIGKNPAAFYKVIEKRAIAANEALGREMIFNVADNGYSEGHIHQWENVCYIGDITAMPELVNSLRGNFVYEDDGILAVGAGSRKEIYDESFKSRDGLKERFQGEYETNLKEINAWLGYKKTSKIALIMSDYGPQGDGTELIATEIPACK